MLLLRETKAAKMKITDLPNELESAKRETFYKQK